MKAAGAESNLRVLVTGGGSGVGMACAQAFASRGAEVILTDHDGDALTHAALQLNAFSRYCDAISDTSVAVFAAEVSARFASIDVLINAAGQGYVRALAMTRMTKAMLPVIRRGSGRRLVINIAAAGGFREADGMFPYASSIAAFDRLSEALVDQVRGSSIDVVRITPTMVRSRPAAKPHGDQLYELQRVDEEDTARRIVELVCAERPEWRRRPPSFSRRA
ncbi:MAG TPA: SDR family NAD(P)-dependent oxidoreductase [Sphingomicrobium sp.]|nr:SDR family NAD(P)-dependent oxidoreductase [Sphingomicrobium sp.]